VFYLFNHLPQPPGPDGFVLRSDVTEPRE